MHISTIMRRTAGSAVALAAAMTLTATPAQAAPPKSCTAPISREARPDGQTVTGVPIVGNGWRSYSISIASDQQRCGGWVHIRHSVYVDTRNLPWGHKLWVVVSTQRSDGRWARAHEAPWVEISSHQGHDEVHLDQWRGIGGGLSVTKVRLWHSATLPGDGSLVPRSTTLVADFHRWNGPEASPIR